MTLIILLQKNMLQAEQSITRKKITHSLYPSLAVALLTVPLWKVRVLAKKIIEINNMYSINF